MLVHCEAATAYEKGAGVTQTIRYDLRALEQLGGDRTRCDFGGGELGGGGVAPPVEGGARGQREAKVVEHVPDIHALGVEVEQAVAEEV